MKPVAICKRSAPNLSARKLGMMRPKNDAPLRIASYNSMKWQHATVKVATHRIEGEFWVNAVLNGVQL